MKNIEAYKRQVDQLFRELRDPLGTNTHRSDPAGAIANSIVDLVEREDGPVTLAQIAREVPGFAKETSPAWEYFVTRPQGEMLIWNCMTEAGCAALRMVMSGRRVAVQYVSSLPYIPEDRVPTDENWQPIVLLPRSTANLDAPNWLMRASRGLRSSALAQAAKKGLTGFRPITPRPGSVISDRFAC
jgi:hypothetical protein